MELKMGHNLARPYQLLKICSSGGGEPCGCVFWPRSCDGAKMNVKIQRCAPGASIFSSFFSFLFFSFFFFFFFFEDGTVGRQSLVRLILHLNELIKFMFIAQEFIILKINQQDFWLRFFFFFCVLLCSKYIHCVWYWLGIQFYKPALYEELS